MPAPLDDAVPVLGGSPRRSAGGRPAEGAALVAPPDGAGVPPVLARLAAELSLTREQTEALAWSLWRFGRAAAPATLRALASDWRQWTAWCEAAQLPVIGAPYNAVARFVEASAGRRAPATLRRMVASIGRVHRLLDRPDPTAHGDVRLALAAAQRDRAAGRKGGQRQAFGLTEDAVAAMLAAIDGEPGNVPTLRDVRDAALLCVARDLLARRSELVALWWEDLVPMPDGSATATIRRSKTDQAGEGRVQYLGPATCRRLDAWRAASEHSAGPIFRSVHVSGRVGKSLHPAAVAVIFKQRASALSVGVRKRLRLDPKAVSGHSARVGMAQDLVAAGAGLPEVMHAGRWKTAAMVARYTEHQAALRGVMAKYHRNAGRPVAERLADDAPPTA